MNLLMIVSLLALPTIAYAACPNIEGKYRMDLGQLKKVGKVTNPAPGTCQFKGEADNILLPDLKGLQEDVRDGYTVGEYKNPYIYVIPMTNNDSCKYYVVGTSRNISFADFKKRMQETQGNTSVYRGTLALNMHQIDLSIFEAMPDGSFNDNPKKKTNRQVSESDKQGGIDVTTMEQEIFRVLANGNLVSTNISTTKGRKLWVVPVNESTESACQYQKIAPEGEMLDPVGYHLDWTLNINCQRLNLPAGAAPYFAQTSVEHDGDIHVGLRGGTHTPWNITGEAPKYYNTHCKAKSYTPGVLINTCTLESSPEDSKLTGIVEMHISPDHKGTKFVVNPGTPGEEVYGECSTSDMGRRTGQ